VKLVNLNCIAFGCFTDLKLGFSDHGRAFHIIYGPNEAGKSTLLRALTGLLYGIPMRTTDAFLHDMRDLRISAELERANGDRFTFVRRKGNRDTLLDVEGRPVPEKKLEEFLGGIGEDLFLNSYRLDHSSLVRGGEELLAGKGDVAQSLFEAGTGIIGLRRILASLDQQADSLFTPRSTKSALVNVSIVEYEKHRSRVRELSVPARDWAEKRAALEKDHEKLNSLKDMLAEKIARREHLSRLRLAIPQAGRRAAVLKDLAALGPVKELPESAAQDREKAQQRKREALRRKAEAEDKLRTLNADLDKLQTPQVFLEYAERIKGLHQRLDGYRNAVRDAPKVQVELEEAERQAEDILRDISPGVSLSQAETLRLTVAQRTRIRSLVAERHRLEERLRAARKREQSAREEWDEGRRILEETPEPKDIGELERVVDRLLKEGDQEAAASFETSDRQLAQSQAEAEAKRLPLWTGTLDRLEMLKVPALERVESFEKELDDLNEKQKWLDGRIKENDRQLEVASEEIKTLQIGWAVPSQDDLNAARSRRDRGWQLVRRAWLEHESNPDEEKKFDAERSLDQAYERAVAGADEVADRLWREADRAAKLASLRSEKDGCTALATKIETEQSKLTADLAAWQQRWSAEWQGSAVAQGLPKEMRAWLSRYQGVLAQIRILREREQSIALKKKHIAECKQELDGALQAIGEPGSTSSGTLVAAIDRAQSLVNKMRDARKERMDCEKEAKRLTKEHGDAAKGLLEAEKGLSAWREGWQEALIPLNLPDQIGVDEASAVVDRLEGLFARIESGAEKSARVDEINLYITQFASDAAFLVADLEPTLGDLPPEQAVARLQALLTSAQEEAAARRSLASQIKGENKVLGQCGREIEAAEGELADLMAKADCADLAALEAAEVRSQKNLVLKNELTSINQILAGFSVGGNLESLIAECAKIDLDQLPFDIAELEKEIAVLEDERSALDRKIGSDRAALDAIDGGDRAAAESEEAQSALASVRVHAEHFLRIKLAGEVLRRHIEHYREQNQDPILKRAGEIFRRLTLGSFASLKTGFDDKDRPVLLGIRPSPGEEEVDVPGMSDGARDQLFLALRLASLEMQLASAEPLPFIADDLLINFDDGRAEATIAELAGLSAKTQVLFFTHHSRLIDLAKRVVPDNAVEFHDLTAF
jgi:uncharacterized protein YhaN